MPPGHVDVRYQRSEKHRFDARTGSDGDRAIFPLTGDRLRALKQVDGEWAPALGEVNMGNSI